MTARSPLMAKILNETDPTDSMPPSNGFAVSKIKHVGLLIRNPAKHDDAGREVDLPRTLQHPHILFMQGLIVYTQVKTPGQVT